MKHPLTFLSLYYAIISNGAFFWQPVSGFAAGGWNAKKTTTGVTSKTELKNHRRHLLGGALGGAILGGRVKRSKAEAATTPTTNASQQQQQPLADLPMIRLRLPQQGFGREYVAIQLMIDGKGPFDFMVDSGLTTEMITPHLQEVLGIQVGRNRISGLAAGGGTASNAIVDLVGASLCCGNFAEEGGSSSSLDLPNLHAVITDFPQEHIDPAHDPVEGMIGMELLSRFDVDFDFPNNRFRFWKPGTADTKGLVEIPAVVINETGLIGIRITVPGAKQPILGFLDCGATFSCINWKAAAALGLPGKTDPSYKKGPVIAAMGIDGRMMGLPTLTQTLSFAGETKTDPATGRYVGFELPPPEWKDWDQVRVAIGDIPAFSSILGDGVTPYEGPAALIGLDVLAQRRVILETGSGDTRRRRVLVSPK